MTAEDTTPYEKPTVGPDLVDILQGMQSLIGEVTNLRRECTRLRMRGVMPPDIAALFAGTPVTLFQDDRGIWGYTIELKSKRTGGRGYPSLVEVARAALGRFQDLGFFDFAETNEDDEDEWDLVDNVFIRVEGFVPGEEEVADLLERTVAHWRHPGHTTLADVMADAERMLLRLRPLAVTL